jgi:hypothetical protein
VLDVVPGPVIGDGVQLTGAPVELRVGGEAPGQAASEVMWSDGVQFVGQLIGQRTGLDGRQDAPGVADDVGVGRKVHAVANRACVPGLAERCGDRFGTDPAVPVPLGGSVAEPDPVYHPCAKEPVVVRIVRSHWLGTIPEVPAVQFGGQPTRDRAIRRP